MKDAFSLIELMVVIAIVAVLAAIAVPAYKDYVTKARLNSALLFINSNIESSIRYYNAHGEFATAEQLGLPMDPDSPDHAVIPGKGVGGRIVFYDNANQTLYNPADCRHGVAWGVIFDAPAGVDIYDVYEEGIDPLSVHDLGVISFNIKFIDVDGIIVKRCGYTYARVVNGSVVFLTENILGGCVNTNANTAYNAETTNIIDTCN